MSHLLPPNLLRLFAPRPHPPFLKPLTKDEANRGPNKLAGVGTLVTRLKEEAEDAEVRQGMEVDDKPGPDSQSGSVSVTVPTPTPQTQARKGKKAASSKQAQSSTAAAAATSTAGGAGAEEDGEVGEVKDDISGESAKAKPPQKKKKQDVVSEMGLVGQEAIKMRRELRKKRQEEYKKNAEKNCRSAPHKETGRMLRADLTCRSAQ